MNGILFDANRQVKSPFLDSVSNTIHLWAVGTEVGKRGKYGWGNDTLYQKLGLPSAGRKSYLVQNYCPVWRPDPCPPLIADLNQQVK